MRTSRAEDARARRRAGGLVGLGLLLVAACGEAGGEDASVDLTVSDAWTAQAEDVAAVYLRIENRGDADRLTGATTDAAGAVSVMAESGGAAIHEAADEAVDVEVPSGATTFSPGAGHIMLSDLTAPLDPGDDIELILAFEDAGERRVTVDVLSWAEAVERNEEGAG